MDIVYILAALLLMVLAFAIYQLTRKDEVEKEISKLEERDESYLLAELSSVSVAVWICFTGGLLLTLNYAITYFSGSDLRHITEWGFTQWSGAFIGAVVTVAITMAQKVLYSNPSHQKAGLLVTTAILVFVIFSEVGSPIEKEEMKMKEASQNSKTYQAVVHAINAGMTPSTGSAYSYDLAEAKSKKAEHEFELGRCERHRPKGQKRVDRCITYEKKQIAKYQAQIDSYHDNMKQEAQYQQQASLSLIDQAKRLENNTDNHSGLIKFVKQAFDTSYLNAMMLASLILIVAFETAFHFVASRQGLLKAALMRKGNQDIIYLNEAKRLKKAQRFKQKADKLRAESNTTQDKDAPNISINKLKDSMQPSNIGFTPATAFTQNTTNTTANKDAGTNEKPASNTDTSKKQRTVFTGGTVQYEEVKATPYSDLKGEVQRGTLQPTVGAIAERIHQDQLTNLTYPQCKKVAVQVVKRLKAERVIKQPNEKLVKASDKYLTENNVTPIKQGEKTGGEPSLENRPSNLGGQVKNDLGGQVKLGSEKGQVQTVIKATDFNALYLHISGQVKTGKLKPSIPAVKKEVHKFVKSESEDLKKVSLLDCHVLTMQIRDKMLNDGIIKENPNYKNGLPKYLVA